MSVVGLVIVGNVGYRLFMKSDIDWKFYAEYLAALHWGKSGELWKHNVVSSGKILMQQRRVRDATANVYTELADDGLRPLLKSTMIGSGQAVTALRRIKQGLRSPCFLFT
jgi:hypothetical protein